MFFFGKERAKENIHSITMTSASNSAGDMDNDINLLKAYGNKVCEHIKMQCMKLKQSFLHFEGWKQVIDQYDPEYTFPDYQVFHIRLKSFYLHIL